MEKILLLGDLYYDYDYISDDINEIAEYIRKNNYKVILNLEGPLHQSRQKVKKRGVNLHQNAITIEILKKLNVVGVTLANNHIMDYGKIGLEETIKILKKNNIKYCGAGENIHEALKPMKIELDKKSIYIFNYGWNIEETRYANLYKSGAAPQKERIILKQLKNIKNNQKNININILHWGFEYNIYPLPKDVELAHKIIQNGSDIVIGHHPHNIQCYEEYDNKRIYYSLGNFYFGSRREKFKNRTFNYKTKNMCDYGLGVVFDVDKKIVEKEIIFYYDQNEKCTKIIENNELKEQLIDNITEIDKDNKEYIDKVKSTCSNINPILGKNKLINIIKISILFTKYKYYKIKNIIKKNRSKK